MVTLAVHRDRLHPLSATIVFCMRCAPAARIFNFSCVASQPLPNSAQSLPSLLNDCRCASYNSIARPKFRFGSMSSSPPPRRPHPSLPIILRPQTTTSFSPARLEPFAFIKHITTPMSPIFCPTCRPVCSPSPRRQDRLCWSGPSLFALRRLPLCPLANSSPFPQEKPRSCHESRSLAFGVMRISTEMVCPGRRQASYSKSHDNFRRTLELR